MYIKSGDMSLAYNYRPISITSVLCRVLEQIIRSSSMLFCTDKKLLADCQFGFKDRRGRVLQLLEVLDD